MQVAVCEDEKEQQEMIIHIIKEWSKMNQQHVDYDSYPSAEQFFEHWNMGKTYDLVFLDIHLDGINGVKAAKKIREQDESMMIVFLTSRIEYVLTGYEVNAWRYLLKPIHPAQLYECLNQVNKEKQRIEQTFLVRYENKLYKVPYQSILYFESFGHNISIHTIDHTYEMRLGISHLESTLPNNFIRCHRSYIVNMDHCTGIEDGQLIVDKNTISFSPKKREELMEYFINKENM